MGSLLKLPHSSFYQATKDGFSLYSAKGESTLFFGGIYLYLYLINALAVFIEAPYKKIGSLPPHAPPAGAAHATKHAHCARADGGPGGRLKTDFASS
jgi:hypothetical protein